MGGIVGHPKGASDDLTDSFTRPGLPAKAIRLRPPVQERPQLGQLLRREFGRGTWGRMPPEPFLHPLCPCPRQPPVDASTGPPDRGGADWRFPARFFEFLAALPPSFPPRQPG